MREDFRTLYLDPGEDTGWCVARGTKLLGGGTEKMWDMADHVWAALTAPDDAMLTAYDLYGYLRNNVDEGAELDLDPEAHYIGRVVMEDFRLYPWVIYGPTGNPTHALDYNPFRTVRLIGAVTLMCRVHDIPLILQPASIKKAAVAAGAEELYWHPLRENRHQNDALQHYVYYTNTELLGMPMPRGDERA